MSFLTPVSAPVTRYSSTDVGAPQLNYASRAANDVKTILKSCLVTGYGSKPSAGWTISKEATTIAEFASPATAMSNYRLRVDDRATVTSWYQVYNNASPVIMGSAVTKNNSAIDTANAGNGWELLVTDRGIMFIENVFNLGVNTIGSRITYFGQLKSGLAVEGNINIAWWCVGHNAPAANDGMPCFFFDISQKVDKYYKLGATVIDGYAHPCLPQFVLIGETTSASDIQLASEWYLSVVGSPVAVQPGLLLQLKSKGDSPFVFKSTTINGRPAILRWPIRASTDSEAILITSNAVAIIYLDYWGY